MTLIYVTAYDEDKGKRISFNPAIYNNDLEEAKKFARRLVSDSFLKRHYSNVVVEIKAYEQIDCTILEEEDF